MVQPLRKIILKNQQVPKINEPINDPELRINYSNADKSGRETETQINRIKYLQELDKRFNHGENEDISPTTESNIQSVGDSPFVEEQKLHTKVT